MNIDPLAKRITQRISTLIVCILFFFVVPMFLVKLTNGYHIWERLDEVSDQYKVIVFYVSRDIFVLVWVGLTALLVLTLEKENWLYFNESSENLLEKRKKKPKVDYSGEIVAIPIIVVVLIIIGAHLAQSYISVLSIFL